MVRGDSLNQEGVQMEKELKQPEVSNPNTLCGKCRRPYSVHPTSECPVFDYNFEQDVQDWYEGRHGGGIGQDSARRMMWGD